MLAEELARVGSSGSPGDHRGADQFGCLGRPDSTGGACCGVDQLVRSGWESSVSPRAFILQTSFDLLPSVVVSDR